MSDKIRAAVIGGSESGKTFLTRGFSRGLWRKRGLRSIVFDPWLREPGAEPWGPQAWVTDDFDRWKFVVSAEKVAPSAVIWDEATAYGGRERENVPLFSQIRHRHPVLFCIGHAYSSILPIMRVNLTDLFISNADPDDAAEWAKVMKDTEVLRAVGLPQYAFLHKRSFQPPKVLRHSAAAIRAGVLP